MVHCKALLVKPFKHRLDETMSFGKGWLHLTGMELCWFSPIDVILLHLFYLMTVICPSI